MVKATPALMTTSFRGAEMGFARAVVSSAVAKPKTARRMVAVVLNTVAKRMVDSGRIIRRFEAIY
jgi:hypothetical protein